MYHFVSLSLTAAVLFAFHQTPVDATTSPTHLPQPIALTSPSDPSSGAGPDLEISFTVDANLLQEENGDVILEFDPICEMVWNVALERDECTYPARYIRYSRSADWTTGSGILFGQGSDGSVWTIDLSQISWPGSAPLLAGDLGSLLAEEVGGENRVGMAGFSL